MKPTKQQRYDMLMEKWELLDEKKMNPIKRWNYKIYYFLKDIRKGE